MLPKRQTCLLPLLKVLGRVNRPSYMALGAHAPVLRERCGTDDRRLIDAPFTPDFVGATITLKGPKARMVRIIGRIVLVAKVLDHIVLDERVGGPAVKA
jgi:hypothetical protein